MGALGAIGLVIFLSVRKNLKDVAGDDFLMADEVDALAAGSPESVRP
jgi:hypothetical protein